MDEIYRAGARKIMKEIEGEDIAFAILKARSPTCGVHEVYDGTFSGTRVPGEGVFAAMLKEAESLPMMRKIWQQDGFRWI